MKEKERKKSNTCLAVVREKPNKNNPLGELVFAADKRISWGMGLHQVGVRPKVTKSNGVLFAGTGVSYICDIVGELMPVPDCPKDMDGFHYVHNMLFPEIKKVFVEKGFGDKEGNISLPEDLSATILVGFKGELFEVNIQDNIILLDAIDTPYAHGCGGRYALGSLEATEGDNLKDLNRKLKKRGYAPRDNVCDARVVLAVCAAARYSPGVDGNVDIIRESFEDSR